MNVSVIGEDLVIDEHVTKSQYFFIKISCDSFEISHTGMVKCFTEITTKNGYYP